MTVVADSGPLHYLGLLGEVDLLRQLYGGVCIPLAVAKELAAPGTPESVKEWMADAPSWLRVKAVVERSDAIFRGTLDAGESEAIALASAIHAGLVLMDDLAARREAQRRNLRVAGTLGILRAAAELDLITVTDAVTRLQATNFYFDEDLVRSIFGKWL
jgi:predicted nucleic acid-binding protein